MTKLPEPPIPVTLLPCPFCGSTARFFKCVEPDTFRVMCTKGGKCTASRDETDPHGYGTAEIAAEAWNTRAHPTPESSLAYLLESVVGILDPISQQDWHGKWRIHTAIELAQKAHALTKAQPSPDTDGLIEKLEAAQLNPSSGMLAEGGNNAIYNQGIETAVAIVRQHHAEYVGGPLPARMRDDKGSHAVIAPSVAANSPTPASCEIRDNDGSMYDTIRKKVEHMPGADELAQELLTLFSEQLFKFRKSEPVSGEHIAIGKQEALAIMRKLGFLVRDYPDDKESRELGVKLKKRLEEGKMDYVKD